ncbi:MAG: DUF3379 family protein [Woeseiaceae bacterium]|nr:DUF3379 family protein [Woeseiaceae bacterium]
MTNEEYKDAIEKDPEFEARIASALEIDVPPLKMPELPDIDTANVTSLPRRRFAAPQWLAVAATVAAVAVLGFFTLGDDHHAYDSLADEIIAHLDHEPYALVVTDVPVSDRRLNNIVPANIATMNHDAGLITYAESCVINGKLVPHLVIQGQQGPITILLMPDEKIDGPQSLMGESINGVLLPVGDGSIAIIGEEGENLEPVEQNLRDSVRWSTT